MTHGLGFYVVTEEVTGVVGQTGADPVDQACGPCPRHSPAFISLPWFCGGLPLSGGNTH